MRFSPTICLDRLMMCFEFHFNKMFFLTSLLLRSCDTNYDTLNVYMRYINVRQEEE